MKSLVPFLQIVSAGNPRFQRFSVLGSQDFFLRVQSGVKRTKKLETANCIYLRKEVNYRLR